MPNEQHLSREDAAFVIRVLAQSSRPLSQKKIKDMIPKSAASARKALPELLRYLAKGGEIRSGRGRSAVYWLPGLEEQAARRIIEALDECPLTPTELRGKFKSLLIDWPQAKCLEMVEQLVKERRVYKVAPLAGRAKLLSARPQATPQDYVKLALRLAITKLAKRGIASEHVLAAAREVLRVPSDRPESSSPSSGPVNPEQLLLDRMLQLNTAAATGALVSLSELRHALQAEIPDKASFDQAVLRLAEQGRVALHRHDYASSLSQAERDALVSDQQGNHFIGIALRI